MLERIAKKLTDAGLIRRTAQLEMMEGIYRAVRTDAIACIEAGTGIGKTIAYGIGAWLAKSDDQKLILSTATIALQEQLINKDLPLLSKILKKRLSYTIAKGRRRYVCHNKLYNAEMPIDTFDKKDLSIIASLRDKLEDRTWDGDRDNLATVIPTKCWTIISTDFAGCSSKRCEFFKECAFYKARKQMREADIIVANHSLLLSDLELGGGAILPAMEDNIYVIDECHHLPALALSHFAKQVTLMGSIEWISSIDRILLKLPASLNLEEFTSQKIKKCMQDLARDITAMRDFIDANQEQFVDRRWRLIILPESMRALAASIANHAIRLSNHLDAILKVLKKKYQEFENSDPAFAHKLSMQLSNLGFLTGRTSNLYKTWLLFSCQTKEDEPPIARWFEPKSVDTKTANFSGNDYTCYASYVTAEKQLKELLWDKLINSAILCSATIKALGSFDDYIGKTGLQGNKRLLTATYQSPFDYSKSILHIPTMTNSPTGAQQNHHLEEVISLLPQLVLKQYGTLVLFTSRKAMQTAFERMPEAVAIDILMQGAQSKSKLIAKHKCRIDANNRSIIFGLASFAEGLDLPGNYCRHVIIHKLPFAVPSNPIEQTRAEWHKSQGLSSFLVSSLPETAIRLTQYAGRLIRHENDTGVLSILDNRLYTKAYGKSLLKNLPGFSRIINVPIAESNLFSQELA